ncbi:MAG: PLP-dependent cysteine synthase family protein [Thermoplasmata archaeon]
MYASDPAPVVGVPARARTSDPAADDPLLRAVGHTPLVPLARLSEVVAGGFELWAKAEFLNPSGSVKDRAALEIVRTGFRDGSLGGARVLLDASSGNTAVAYAMLGARLGFRVELCLPRNASAERVARIRNYGAEILFTDPGEGTDGAQREARRRAEENPARYWYPDQYNHPSNPDAHYRGTGPEIWSGTRGRVTHFVAGVGTGGTISGTGRYLKEQRPGLRVIGVEPAGPVHGIEGLKHLPTALRPSTYDERVVDATVRIETEVAAAMRRRLASEEGLSVGISSGAAVAVAAEIGRANPGGVVVTLLPDGDRHPLREGEA